MPDIPGPPIPHERPFSSPPRAFTQGVGTLFQFVGVSLFLVMMSVCCLSSLLSKDYAARPDRTRVGWHLPGDKPDAPSYSYARAMTLSVTLGVFYGMGLAGVGLGLQAQRRAAPWLGVVLSGLGTAFWIVQAVFAIRPLGSVVLTILAIALAALFGGLFVLAVGALREMLASPPPVGNEILPADYKVPYSHLHQDPPEVRLARELEQRRQRLAVEQKELEMLEEKLRKKIKGDER
jgi:hypothetical protein